MVQDFGKKYADFLRTTQKEEKRIEEQKRKQAADEADNRRQRKDLGPKVWGAFRDLVISKGADVNKHFGSSYFLADESTPNRLRVTRAGKPGELLLQYIPDKAVIEFSAGTCKGLYNIGIDPKDGAAYLVDGMESELDQVSAAEHLLTECLDKIKG